MSVMRAGRLASSLMNCAIGRVGRKNVCRLPSNGVFVAQPRVYSKHQDRDQRPPELAARESDSSRASMSRLRCLVATISAIIASRCYGGVNKQTNTLHLEYRVTYLHFFGRIHVAEADFVGAVGCENTLSGQ